jgi:predicted TPR repeat methyltransferase
MHKPLQSFHDELNRLFTKASQDYQNGLLDAAEQSYLQLLDYFAEAPVLHYNLGLVYYDKGQYEMARDSFARAVELQPGDPDSLFNLALSKKRLGDLLGAIDTYKQVLAIDPVCIDALYNLAGCYKDSSQHTDAMAAYREVLQLAPEHPSANSNLAFLYHLDGDSERAVWHYRKVLECHPEHQAAKHMIAALTGALATSSPDLYVEKMFDNYSEHYERSLVTELEYCVPGTIRKLFDQSFAGQRSFAHGLDLGCGTGLGGQAFADRVQVFDGLDLSAKMIALAAKKMLYRSLYSGNIVGFLQSVEDDFDFFLAADVFVYVGELRETFLLLRQRARRDVLFCFSTEAGAGDSYKLQETGRFTHSPLYIVELAKATGWQVAVRQETVLRKEKGIWVKGDLWFLQLA